MKLRIILAGLIFGFLVGCAILFVPPYHSSPLYVIQHTEESGLNRIGRSLALNPYSNARDVFLMGMGLLHVVAWSVTGALAFWGGATLAGRFLALQNR